jgi:hypothetical protein
MRIYRQVKISSDFNINVSARQGMSYSIGG